MIRSVAIGTVFLACGILGGSSGSHAQPLGDVATPDGSLGQGAGWAQGWGFAAPGVYREQNPMIRQRLTGLLHLAHAQAAAQACDQVEVSDKAVRQLFASDSFGALSSGERTFVAQRHSALVDKLTALVGGEACEWAYENYGPKGAMQPGLIRAKDPETTSSLSRLKSQLVPLPPRRPADL